MTRFLHKNIFLLLFICLFQKPVQAIDGTGVAFKVSLAGKRYHNLSFLIEEDIRPKHNFREAEWFLTTASIVTLKPKPDICYFVTIRHQKN